MNTQAESLTTPIMDIVKQALSLILVVAGVAAFYFFGEIQLLYRVLSLVGIIIVALLLLLTTGAGRNVWGFMLEAKQEVRKVVWPSRTETWQTTLMVFAMVFIVGLVLWLFDMFLFWGIRLLTGQGG
jgi:preprotein translocase subunit SecE